MILVRLTHPFPSLPPSLPYLPPSFSVSIEDPTADPPICAYLVEADVHGPDVKRTYTQALKGERRREEGREEGGERRRTGGRTTLRANATKSFVSSPFLLISLNLQSITLLRKPVR